MFKVRAFCHGLVVVAVSAGLFLGCGSSDSARTKNSAVMAGTSCTKTGQVKTISKQPLVCAKTSSGLKWYGVNRASGTPVKCSSLGQLRRRENIIWVCGKDGKKTIWKATLPLPVAAANFVTTLPGSTSPTSIAAQLESTSPSAGVPSNDLLTNTNLVDESIKIGVGEALNSLVPVDESQPWVLAASADVDPAARDFTQDSSGNAYALGSFCGDRMTFGGKIMVGNERGGSDCSVSLSKVAPNGTLQWNAVVNGEGGQNWGESVVVNAAGDVFITGFFAGGSVTTGDVTIDAINPGYNSFLMKFNDDGIAQWGKVLGGNTTKDIKYDWSIDLVGNGSHLYVAGLIDGLNKTVTLGAKSVVSSSANDMFVAKLDATTGDAQWIKSFPVSTPYLKNNAVVDSSGNLYVVASFTAATLTVGTTPTTTLTNAKAGTSDAFVVKISTSGVPQWSTRIGAEGEDEAGNIALSKSGVVVSGNFDSEELALGSSVLKRTGTGTGFVAHISSAGAITSSFATPGSLRLSASEGNISEDGDGNVYLSGVFTGDVTVGAQTFSTPKNSYDAFLVKMSSSGETLWAEQFGNTGNTGSAYVQADDAGASIFFDTGARTDVVVGTVTVKSGLILMRVGRSGVLP
jgi:hypothetical protein